MTLRNILLSLLLFFPAHVLPQLGGNSTYSFLRLTNSARAAALGGKVVSIWDDDLNLPFHNPALLNQGMSRHLVLNYVNYFTDINYGYVSYAGHMDKLGTLAAGIHYINYGDFIAADRYGNINGEFTASELAVNLIWSRYIDSLIHLGVNVKPVYSVMETYRSTGIAADIGIVYVSRDSLFSAGLTLKNIGSQLTAYHSGHKEPLPFEIEAGISQKLEHAPFRFSLVAHNLQRFDLSYESTVIETDPFTGEPIKENRLEELADKMMRHVILGVEFMPLKTFHLRFGYNYLRREELKLDTRVAMVGFSWGFGLNLTGLQLSFGRASYHLAGATSHFSLSTDFSSLFGKRI